MLIVRIKTRDLFRVTRKCESKRARLLAITCEGQNYELLYAMDEYRER
jgi:hypothetical protein